MKTKPTNKKIWPCATCKDNTPEKPKIEWGCCNDGLGICEKCLDYGREKSMRGEA